MKISFVTFLGTDSFLPGVLALNQSLKFYNKGCDLLVLATKAVSHESIDLLNIKNINFKIIENIENPHLLVADERGFKHMFTKLRIFDLCDYEKVVYLDSDLLICSNIEKLFEAPHLSAVIAGGLLKENSSWNELNAGLLVVEPSSKLAEKMYASINRLPSKDGSDQGFLHSFYPDWRQRTELHLDHRYNVPLIYLDRYCDESGFSFSYIKKRLNTNIAILHYWGAIKPWHFDIKTFSRRDKSKQVQAIILWWDMFNMALEDEY